MPGGLSSATIEFLGSHVPSDYSPYQTVWTRYVPYGDGSLSLKEARETAEREVITKALRKHSGKLTPAAAELGISRPTLYELMEKLEIGKSDQVRNASDPV